MYHFTNPIKNKSIHEILSGDNTSYFEDLDKVDEILELSYRDDPNYQGGEYKNGEPTSEYEGLESVILLKFDISRFKRIIETLNNSYTVLLRLFSCEPEPKGSEYEIIVEEITEDWSEGNGRSYTTDKWEDEINTSLNKEYDIFSLSETSSDVTIDITSIFDSWRTENLGAVIRRMPVTEETSQKFFSRATNTIWQPELVLKYKDALRISNYNEIDAEENEKLIAKPTNLQSKYVRGSKVKIDVNIKKRFTEQKWIEDEIEIRNNYLTNGSLRYRVFDNIANKIVVPYSQESILGFSESGYSVNLDLKNVMPLRTYELEIAKFDKDGKYKNSIYSNTFKVTRDE